MLFLFRHCFAPNTRWNSREKSQAGHHQTESLAQSFMVVQLCYACSLDRKGFFWHLVSAGNKIPESATTLQELREIELYEPGAQYVIENFAFCVGLIMLSRSCLRWEGFTQPEVKAKSPEQFRQWKDKHRLTCQWCFAYDCGRSMLHAIHRLVTDIALQDRKSVV